MRYRAPLLILLASLLASAAVAASPPLTPFGLGLLKIGMREADAARRLGLRIAPDDEVNGWECRLDELPGHPGLSVMVERGVVTRIGIASPSRLKTDRGFGIGAREADLRRAYGKALKVATAAYEAEPAHDLTVWAIRGKRGVRYGTDARGRVQAIYAGSKSIANIEGCL